MIDRQRFAAVLKVQRPGRSFEAGKTDAVLPRLQRELFCCKIDCRKKPKTIEEMITASVAGGQVTEFLATSKSYRGGPRCQQRNYNK